MNEHVDAALAAALEGGNGGNGAAPAGEAKNPLLAALGDRVRNLRAQRGLTRKAVAIAADVSERHLAIGLNCALGATLMRPYIQELNRVAEDTFISCYPNAGLPNPMSDTGFDETPEITSRLVHEFAAEGLVNILGGCCGTTPDHIGAIAKAVAPVKTRQLFYREPTALA